MRLVYNHAWWRIIIRRGYDGKEKRTKPSFSGANRIALVLPALYTELERSALGSILDALSTLGINYYVDGRIRIAGDEVFRPCAEKWASEIRAVGAVPPLCLTWARKATPEDQAALSGPVDLESVMQFFDLVLHVAATDRLHRLVCKKGKRAGVRPVTQCRRQRSLQV